MMGLLGLIVALQLGTLLRVWPRRARPKDADALLAVREALAECGLPRDLPDGTDLMPTGKFHEVVHHAAVRLAITAPRTVRDLADWLERQR